MASLAVLATWVLATTHPFDAHGCRVHALATGSGSSVRLKQQGMEFSVWVCKHAAHSQLKAMAPA
eukprot:scaffold114367_cov17-Tisochrysis_lutea.AAC.3